MKKATYILSIIILSLLSVGATVQAQDAQKSDKNSFNLNPDGSYSGEFNSFIDETNNIGRLFFSKINGIKRVDDKTLLTIKRNGYLTYPIRIEVDRGRISCGVLVQGIFPISMRKKRSVRTIDGKIKKDNIIEPTSLHTWIVSDLEENQNHFTIKIYSTKNDALLAEKTFLIKDAIPTCYTQLTYTDVNGIEHTVRESVKLSEISVNYDIPIKISVYEPDNKKCLIRGYALDDSWKMGNTLVEPNNDSVFSVKQMALIRRLPQRNNNDDIVWIDDVVFIDSEGRRRRIEIPFIFYK